MNPFSYKSNCVIKELKSLLWLFKVSTLQFAGAQLASLQPAASALQADA